MNVIPSIDLLQGKVVRLLKGQYDRVTEYAEDPAPIVQGWRHLVARMHVVDLEGARAGKPVQLAAVRRIVEAFGQGVQVGGGIRDLEAVSAYLELGVRWVVMGTAAIAHPERVREIALRHPGCLIVAVDARNGKVATEGWVNQSERLAVDVVRELSDLPLAGILYTDIERDGTEVGPNVEQTARLAREGGVEVIASGGVGTLDHLRALSRAAQGIPLNHAIIGRSLHEKRFTLREAVDAAAIPSED